MTDASFQQHLRGTPEAQFGDYFALLKPRVMSLVVFTALVGLLAAPGGVHPMVGFSAILFIAVGAGASGALNMWWDADIDRSCGARAPPDPSGRVERGRGAGDRLALSGCRSRCWGWPRTGWRRAAGLHDLLLRRHLHDVAEALRRRRTSSSAARRAPFPPMIGWVAVTGSVSLEAVLMFAPDLHVDAAAFLGARAVHEIRLRRGKGADADGDPWPAATRAQIWIYTLLLAPVALGLASPPSAGRSTSPPPWC
jgi:protoheme IX farnesyltransferase